MTKNVNQSKQYRIYLKHDRQWVKVPEDVYKEHTRFHDAFRKRQQSHKQYACSKNKFWLCNADCYNCEFRRAGGILSLDYTVSNEDGNEVSPLDTIPDTAPSIEEVLCDKAELDELFARLNELMPEARKIGELRMQGLTDEAIANIIGIKRTTFRSRLEKTKAQLAKEYPDRFYPYLLTPVSGCRFGGRRLFFKKLSPIFVNHLCSPPVGSVRSTTESSGTEVNDMNAVNNKSPADTKVIDVLNAISLVSARLARKLTIQRCSRLAGPAVFRRS